MHLELVTLRAVNNDSVHGTSVSLSLDINRPDKGTLWVASCHSSSFESKYRRQLTTWFWVQLSRDMLFWFRKANAVLSSSSCSYCYTQSWYCALCLILSKRSLGSIIILNKSSYDYYEPSLDMINYYKHWNYVACTFQPALGSTDIFV